MVWRESRECNSGERFVTRGTADSGAVSFGGPPVPMRRELTSLILLVAVVLTVYSPVRHYGFLCYDDNYFITDNPPVYSGLSWQSIGCALTAPIAGNWHPVTTISHILDCEFLGVNAGSMHVINVLIHASNVFLLCLLLRRLTGAVWRSAAAAAIFALHPLRVESVAWISERKDVLSAFFFMLTLLAYEKYVESQNQFQLDAKGVSASEASGGVAPGSSEMRKPARPGARSPSFWYRLALGAFALGLMSKPMVVTLPFVLLLLDYWPLGRFPSSAHTFQPSGQNRFLDRFDFRTLGELAREKGWFFVLSAVSCWITLRTQASGRAVDLPLGIGERVINAVLSYTRYLGKLFCPADLAVIYPHPGFHYPHSDRWPVWQICAAAVLLLAISVLFLLQLRRRPYLAVGWFWYLGTLLPVSGVVQTGQQAMADRYTYIPLIGPVVGLVWAASEFCGSSRARKVAFGALTLAAVAACAALTMRQLRYWQDSRTLFEHAVLVTPDNPVAQSNLGIALAMEGKPSLAAVRYRAALAIDPRQPQAHFNLAGLLKAQEHWAQAAEHYLAAARLRPMRYEPYLGLAEVLVALGRNKEAALHLEEALRLNPDLPAASLNDLAWVLATSGQAEQRDPDRALRFAERACKLTDYKVTVMVGTLAAAYAAAGRFLEAVKTAEMACARATASGDEVLLRKNQELLELYRSGRPYREP